jgi:hypothetical protein
VIQGIPTPRLALVGWTAVAAAGWVAGAHALDGRAVPATTVATVAMWLLWGAVLVTLIVPSTVGLTVVRMLAPLAAAAAVTIWICGAGAWRGPLLFGLVAVFTALVFSADLGQSFVQASAYGDEQRLLLRAPAALIPALVVSWTLWAATTVSGVVFLSAQRWLIGALLTALAAGLGVVLLPRAHQLSRRWLVLVPTGVVVHDPTVLADTFMVTKPKVARVRLAEADTEAADLSGPAAGHLVEVSLKGMETVVLAGTRAKPAGTALHVQSFLVAPSRPGRALEAAAAGRLTVG